MADHLSIAASVIAVIGAVETVCKTLNKVKKLRNAPCEFFALLNEISDLGIVLRDVESHLSSLATQSQIPEEHLQTLLSLINRAKDQMMELDKLIHQRLIKADSSSGHHRISRSQWVKASHTITRFRSALRDTRSNIVTQMIVLNSYV